MPRFALLVLAVLLVPAVQAQAPLVVGATYELAGRPLVVRVDPVTYAPLETLRPPAAPDVLYLGEAKMSSGGDVSVFEFIPYTKTTTRELLNGPDSSARYVFALPSKDFASAATQRIYESWGGSGALEYGVMALPIKLRAAPFHYEQSLSLGPSIGYVIRMSQRDEIYGALTLSTGISSVDVNAGDSDGIEESDGDRAAYYLAGGLVLHVGVFQVGLLGGIDWINGENQDAWDYQGEPWVSVGLGINGFLTDRKRANVTGQ